MSTEENHDNDWLYALIAKDDFDFDAEVNNIITSSNTETKKVIDSIADLAELELKKRCYRPELLKYDFVDPYVDNIKDIKVCICRNCIKAFLISKTKYQYSQDSVRESLIVQFKRRLQQYYSTL